MPYAIVKPVLDYSVRNLCVRPYPLHPKGCPNFGKKDGCPPLAEPISEILDMAAPVYAIWNAFDLLAHVENMRLKHPHWSDRQLYCCLYWQPRARKYLEGQIHTFSTRIMARKVYCPEAHGVNVTATMKTLGIELEWPPVNVAYQIILAGEFAPTADKGRK